MEAYPLIKCCSSHLMIFSSSSSSWAIQLRIEDIGKEYIKKNIFADLWKNNKLKKLRPMAFWGSLGIILSVWLNQFVFSNYQKKML